MKPWATFLSALLLLACNSVHAEDDRLQKDYPKTGDKKSADIANIRGCANSLLGCPTPPENKKPARCNNTADCGANKYCHVVFKMCLPHLTPAPPKRPPKLPHEGVCASNADCGINQICHTFFGKCFDRPPVPTTSTSGRSIQACANTTECAPGHYCHNYFHMCLPNLTALFDPTSPTPRGGCSSDSDCDPFEFCHSMLHLCLSLHIMPTASSRPTKGRRYSCSSDADCKLTEFCHFLIGTVAQQLRTRNPQRPSVSGICIVNRYLQKPASNSRDTQLNCSRESDCGKGKCCLAGLGICAGYRLQGELCVVKDVQFACPCISGYECVPTPGRTMRIRKLEKKLQIPREKKIEVVRRWKKIKFKVGKCRGISS